MRGKSSGMGPAWVGAAAVLLLCLGTVWACPVPLTWGGGEARRGETPYGGGVYPNLPGQEGAMILRVRVDGEVGDMDLEDYTLGVTAAEMPASFGPQALRAQAVAARTYALYKLRSSPHHPDFDLCDSSSCCAAFRDMGAFAAEKGEFYAEKLRSAVADTAGEVLSENGQPILAVFHSSSAGQTAGAKEVWGAEVPYLTPVTTPETAEEVPNLETEVEVSRREVEEKLGPWEGPLVGERELTPSGRVASLTLCGRTLTGKEVRGLFSLRSTDFTLTETEEGLVFRVRGYGHGVGMSQYGAELLDRQGLSYGEILAHYYPSTALVTWDTLEG